MTSKDTHKELKKRRLNERHFQHNDVFFTGTPKGKVTEYTVTGLVPLLIQRKGESRSKMARAMIDSHYDQPEAWAYQNHADATMVETYYRQKELEDYKTFIGDESETITLSKSAFCHLLANYDSNNQLIKAYIRSRL